VSGPVRLAIFGVAGRMGRLILELSLDSALEMPIAAVERSGHPWQGRDIGVCLGREPLGIAVTSESGPALDVCDVVLDFSHPSSTRALIPQVADSGAALVCGTTGLTREDRAALETLGRSNPLVYAANMSLGVNVLLSLAAQASVLLGPDYDLEVFELHHRHKKDSPSGTALALAEAVQRSGGPSPMGLHMRGRGQTGPRSGSEIGMASLRGGEVAGEHTVYLLGPDERVELTHRAGDRRAFVRGALHAARWVVGQPPGLYTMADVLGLAG